jgi:hypothetical protein
MMTLMSGALKICVRALETCEPSYTDMHARLFFMLEACGKQRTVGRVAARSPPRREVGSIVAGHATH